MDELKIILKPTNTDCDFKNIYETFKITDFKNIYETFKITITNGGFTHLRQKKMYMFTWIQKDWFDKYFKMSTILTYFGLKTLARE